MNTTPYRMDQTHLVSELSPEQRTQLLALPKEEQPEDLIDNLRRARVNLYKKAIQDPRSWQDPEIVNSPKTLSRPGSRLNKMAQRKETNNDFSADRIACAAYPNMLGVCRISVAVS